MRRPRNGRAPPALRRWIRTPLDLKALDGERVEFEVPGEHTEVAGEDASRAFGVPRPLAQIEGGVAAEEFDGFAAFGRWAEVLSHGSSPGHGRGGIVPLSTTRPSTRTRRARGWLVVLRAALP